MGKDERQSTRIPALGQVRQEYRFLLLGGLGIFVLCLGGLGLAMAAAVGLLVFDVIVCRGYARALGHPPRSAVFAGLITKLLGFQFFTFALLALGAFFVFQSVFSW